MQAYALPLDDLLMVLRPSGQAYHLRAFLPASFPPLSARRGERLVADVTLIAGQIQTCLICNQQGVVRLEADQALACVRSREELVWIVRSVSTSPPGTPPPSAGATPPASGADAPGVALPWVARPPPIGRHAEPGALASLSHRQRQLWLLISGRRTVHELAHLLGIALETLEQELTTLERRGLITSGSLQQRR